MSRRHVAVVLAVTLLVVMHAPAVVGAESAKLVVGSQHSTDIDFSNSEVLDNLTVDGSGDSAHLQLSQDTPYTVARGSDTTNGFTSNKAGLKINTNEDISQVEIELSDQTSGATTAYLETTDGTVLDTSSISNGKATLTADLSANTDYYVVVDADGSDWTNGYDDSPTFPYTGEAFDITSGISGGSEFNNAYAIKSITAQSFGDSAQYISQNHSISNAEEAAINITQASNVSVEAEVRTDDGTVLGSDTISSTGNHTIALANTSSSQLETVLDVEVTGENPQFELADESILFQDRPPDIDNASASPAGGDVIGGQPELSLNVSDPEFGTAQGEELTVEWYVDGEKRGESTATQNGTVSYTLEEIEGGEHTWHAVVTDSYGVSTTSDTFNFSAPSELKVFSETEPDQLIDDNVSLRVRFFADDTEEVIEREVTDGTVDLAGLPANQRYVVTVAADNDNWTYRRIIIDSLIETNSIYLLNTSVPSSEIVFELDDPTGQFPPEETTLYIEKPITKDYDNDSETETRYQVIAGDSFGASGDFPARLAQDARYRLRVETKDGDSSRILGFYSVSGSGVEPLQIERVEPSGDSDAGASFRASIDEKEGEDYIAIRYTDFSESTEYVEYEVVDQNGTVVVPNTTRQADEFADLYEIPAEYGDDPSFTVNYQVVRESQNSAGSIDIGRLSGIADRFGLDPQICRCCPGRPSSGRWGWSSSQTNASRR